MIVVDGVPVVGGDRVEKLKNVIRKIYGKFGKLVNEHYPMEENGSTKGYIFLEFSHHANALEAVKNTNNYKLDKQHTFIVLSYEVMSILINILKHRISFFFVL